MNQQNNNKNKIGKWNDTITNGWQGPGQCHIHLHKVVQVSGDSPVTT
jgi:hypothetical protein